MPNSKLCYPHSLFSHAHTNPPSEHTTFTTYGPPNPKSGECSSHQPPCPRMILCMGFLLLQVQPGAGALDARVVTPARGVTEADPVLRLQSARAAAKLPLGIQATPVSHPQGFTRVQKRSYIRALRRAQIHGGAGIRVDGSTLIPVTYPRTRLTLIAQSADPAPTSPLPVPAHMRLDIMILSRRT